MLALLIVGLLSSVQLNAADWITILLGVSSAVVLALGLVAYIYLLVNDRDALRSERFTLAKMSIERGLMGDTASGFRQVRADEVSEALPASRSELDS